MKMKKWEKEKYGDPLIYGILHMKGKDYPIRCFTWYAFLLRINEIMREQEITFPVGEDEKMRMVTLKVDQTERFR